MPGLSVANAPRSRCNPYMAGRAQTPKWFANFRNAYAIHNVIAMRSELPFFLIRRPDDGPMEWMELTDPHHRLEPFHFEIYFGKESVRDRYYEKALAEARESDRPIVRELFGFCDMFYALPGDEDTYLYAGQFCRHSPEWEWLGARWRDVTDQEPASANPDFGHFVRMALRLPVLEGKLLDAVSRFVELYGEYLTGGDGTDVQEDIDALNRDYFAPLWPITDWVDSVISDDKFQLPPWHYDGELTDWIKEGIGIERLPTTTIALMPRDEPGETLDPVQTLVRNAAIQRECIAFARGLPETSATRLQDYGVSIITSARRGKSVGRARLELRECAQKFQALIQDKFGVRSAAGIGRSLSPGAPLYESHRDAVLALHMCVQLDKDVLYHDEHGGSEDFRYAELQKSATAVGDALDRQNSTQLKLASDQYVQRVLRYANERIEVARSQFLALLFQLFDRVQRRNPMRNDVRDRFAGELTARLEEARSLALVIACFNEALQRLFFVSSKVWHGPSVMRLEAALQYLRENFAEPLPLPDVARRAGFSVPAFGRVFKQATGTSYLAYLRALRIEHAKKLLATTPMTTEQIAQACGFNSQHHLIRSFKKVTQQTPGAYRKANAS